jgi:Carboxypeptidase regulatory-like domain
MLDRGLRGIRRLPWKRLQLGILVAIVLLSVGPKVLVGQNIVGSIVGIVTDPTGAAVVGCSITVVNEGTGISVRATTDSTGTYSVTNLLTGVYTIKATMEGFKTHQVSGIQLLAAQNVRQNIALEVGTVQQSVEVSGQAPLVNTETPTIGGELTSRQLVELPFMTETIDRIFELLPGVSRGTVNGNGNPIINGASYYGSSNFTVNGVSVNNPMQGGGGNVTYVGDEEAMSLVNLPSVGTLQEFKVESGNVNAEYSGVVPVTMVTKQGTNVFHGMLYEFNENKVLNANYFDFNAYSIDQGPYNRNQFGANIGGPIRKNRLFFFAAYDGLREVHPNLVQQNFASPAMRGGDFSALCSSFDANGVCTSGNGTQLYNPWTGAPFVRNQIPSNMITSQAKKLLEFVPDPTTAGSPGLPNEAPNYNAMVGNRFGTNGGQLRLDARITDKDNANVYYSQSVGDPWFYGASGPPTYGNAADYGYKFYNTSVTETHVFSPGMLNEFRLGWVHAIRRSNGQNLDFKPWDLFPQIPVSDNGGLPSVSISGYSSISDRGKGGQQFYDVDIVDNFTLVKGTHTLKVGFQETGYKLYVPRGGPQYSFATIRPLGTFSFNGRWTGGRGWPGLPTSPGNAFADFLLGLPNATSYGIKVENYVAWDRHWEGYVQDTWQASPRLTLTYGLRYLYQTPYKFRGNRVSYFDLTNLKLALPQDSDAPTLPDGGIPRLFDTYRDLFETTKQAGFSKDFYTPDRNNLGPRIGFAYRPFGDTKTVIRGGWGVYYNSIPAGYGPLQTMFNLPFGGAFNYRSHLPGNPAEPFQPDITFQDPFPAGLVVGLASSPSVFYTPQDYRNGIMHQWNLTAERQFGQDWRLRLSYLGSHTSSDLMSGNNINSPDIQQPNVPTEDQLPYRPFDTVNTTSSTGWGNFNSLQVEATKRFSSGFMMEANYAWSRSLDIYDFCCTSVQNPAHPELDYGNSAKVFRHKLVVHSLWEVPVGHGKKYLNSNKWIDPILGGWQVSAIGTYRTGATMSVYLSDPGTMVGWFTGRADAVAGADPYQGAQHGTHDTYNGVQWFSPEAWAPPQPWTYGNSPRNGYFAPGYWKWDLSIMKNYRMPWEGHQLQIKADFVNAFNHYNLGEPNNYLPDERDGGSPDPTFGKIYWGWDPREVRVGFRYTF